MKFNIYSIVACILLFSSQPELQSNAKKEKTAQLKPTDSEVNKVINQIKNGKLPTSLLGPLGDLLNKVGKTILSGDIIGIQTANLGKLPRELSPKKAVALSGKVTFLKETVDCKVIFGKEVDSIGKARMGFSLDVALGKSYKVSDMSFLTSLGVPASTLNKFGDIDLPQPHIIFSTFDSYTDPNSGVAYKAGITLSTKTKVATLMNMVKKEVNNLTGGNADKLPFLAKVSDTSPVVFNIAVGFKGTNFQSFSGEIALPMEAGIDLAKLRAQEKKFKPKIKAPFSDLNKPIKEVTGLLSKAPISSIKSIAVGNFLASVGIVSNSFKLSFGAEINVTTNTGTHYGMRGTIGLTPKQLAIELQKSPSIKSMPMGGGVSIENIALATYTDFKLLASSGIPFSGLGLLGEVKFPFEGDKVTIGLAGKIEVSGDFMLMGNVKNLDTKKMAVFNAQLIQNLAHAVKFDTSALTKAMKNMPRIVINDGLIYVSTKEANLGGRIFPLGLGVSLDVLINDMKAKMAIAGNTQELSMMGYLSKISNPYIVISGAGPDKKFGTNDDGPLIDFQISSTDPLKAKFYATSKVTLPPVKISGQGNMYLTPVEIDASFSSQIANLFKAQFEVAFNPRNIPASKISFELNSTERKNFIGKVFTQLDQEIKKAQKGAAKILLVPLRAITKELGKGISKLNIQIPSRIFANLTAKTWSGSMEIKGGSITLPGIGKINLNVPTISFSLKQPEQIITKLAEKWAKVMIGNVTSSFTKTAEKVKEKAEEVKKIAEEKVKELATETKRKAAAVAKEAKKVKDAAEKKAKEVAAAAAREAKKVKDAAAAAAKAAAQKAKSVIKDVGSFFGF